MHNNLLEISKQLFAQTEIDRILTVAIDSAIDFSGAECGMVILFDEDGEILFESARNIGKDDIDNPEFEISRTIINRAKSTRKPVCLRNALADPSLRASDSANRLKILSVICIPLVHEDYLFGCVYLDNRTLAGVFSSEAVDFMCEFADLISLAAWHALERKKLYNQITVLEKGLREKYVFDFILGHHPKMVEILKVIAQIADTDATVLITGESGTGKELIAHALYNNSNRKNKPFIPINCAALPENLLESELFGHVKGAFTGALTDKDGWFEIANQGTIFLDEVNEMSMALQTKLLRILQTGEYSPVGSTNIQKCNVRVIAATSENLQDLVGKKRFREEVYYRLNVVDLYLPPLRDRKCDIPLLAKHFLDLYSKKYKKKELYLSREAELQLLSYEYPGNVRELENIIQRAVVLAEGHTIDSHHFPPTLKRGETKTSGGSVIKPYKVEKQHILDEFEKKYISNCLKAANGNISKAARDAGIHLKNFHVKMSKHKINPRKFKKRK